MLPLRATLLATLVLPVTPVAAQITPPAEAPTPTPRPTPTPSSAPVSSPTPSLIPAPTARPLSAPAPEPSDTPAPPVIASPLPSEDHAAEQAPAWPWMLGAAVLAIGGIGLWLARRQRAPDDAEIGGSANPAEPNQVERLPVERSEAAKAATIASAASSAHVAIPRARLSLAFRPTRVGFNMLSATVEGELTIANDGDVPTADVRVRTVLLGAHADQDADIAGFLAEPIGRPVVPPFSLAPGERRPIRVVAATPRQGLRQMTAGGRPLFVPVLAVNVRVGDMQVAQAFAIGVERVDSAKLAPFWLDVPDRTYTEVAARPHGPAIERRG